LTESGQEIVVTLDLDIVTTGKMKDDMQKAIPVTQNNVKESRTDALVDNRRLQTKPNGITPPVDGEHFEVNRTFKFRRSTVRMLNRLKAENQDENVYLSSIVEEAIRYYYRHILYENQA
jgi:hypothetical protein